MTSHYSQRREIQVSANTYSFSFKI